MSEATTETLSAQAIFDRVATHLFAQGHKAMDGEACRYRAEDGSRCAVGCLIPDDAYSLDMENHPVDDLLFNTNEDWIEEGEEPQPEFPAFHALFRQHLGLLEALQWVHDGIGRDILGAWDSTEAMRAALGSVAIRHGLDDRILATLSFGDR